MPHTLLWATNRSAARRSRICEQTRDLHTADGEVAQVITGATTIAIATAAEREQPDSIVAASRGHSALPDPIVGSVTRRPLAIAPCPVLVVTAAAEGAG